MKSILFCTVLVAATFLFCGHSTLEARRYSHVHVNVGTTVVQRPAYGSYIVRPVRPQPAPVYVYPTYPEQIVVYPAQTYHVQEVVAVPVYQPTPQFSLFSFGLSLFR